MTCKKYSKWNWSGYTNTSKNRLKTKVVTRDKDFSNDKMVNQGSSRRQTVKIMNSHPPTGTTYLYLYIKQLLLKKVWKLVWRASTQQRIKGPPTLSTATHSGNLTITELIPEEWGVCAPHEAPQPLGPTPEMNLQNVCL